MEQNEIIQAVIQVIPYPQQMKDIDFSESDAVRFAWRGVTYRVDKTLDVGECDRGCLRGSDLAILMRELLKKGQRI